MIYLDHAATTPLDPRVFEAMLPFLRETFGNASSVHTAGRLARFAVEDCRERVAAVLGAEPSEVIFTSGATESINAALRGCLEAQPPERNRLVTASTEHEAVLKTAEALVRRGYEATFLSPGPHGYPETASLASSLDERVGVVSLMAVNNETGSVAPLAAYARLCRERNVVFHVDGVQAVGAYDLKQEAAEVDLLSLSGHKIYGPKGAGVLVVRGGVPFEPLIRGGSQERGRRAGTENVAALVGFAHALELAVREGPERRRQVEGLRDRLREAIRSLIQGPLLFNTPEGSDAAPHILNVSFPPRDGKPIDGEMLLLGLDMEGICVSSGSACTSGAIEPSHVLLAMGRDRATASATVRFSLGKDSRPEEVDRAAEGLARVITRMRGR